MKNLTHFRKDFLYFVTLVVFSFLLTSSSLFGQTTKLVRLGTDGKLVYTPMNTNGDVIPDFSGVGYKNSESSIPTVTVVKTISPVSGDNTSNIQNAINEVGNMPIQSNGFRGAILLRPGTYNIHNTMNITKSGIVLYGSGSGSTGTILRGNQSKSYDILNVKGPGTVSDDGAEREVTDSYVPIGGKKLTIGGGHNFRVGDWINYHHVVNQAWIDLLKMGQYGWTVGAYDYKIERQIKRIEGNVIYIDAPVGDPLDKRYSRAYVSKITSSSRIENVGVENIRFTSTYKSDTDADHARNALTFENSKNCWAKNLIVYYLAYSAVRAVDGSIFITVDNCKMYDPKSPPEGGNRYPFVIEGQRALFMNCYARQGRHDFAMGSHTIGPNVVWNTLSEDVVDNCDIGPHQRWSALTLFDQVKTDMDINVQNRKGSGTGHGWAGAQMMLWNCEARRMVVQDPPGPYTNWAIGCIGNVTNCAQYGCEPLAYTESTGTHITAIPSLFQAQLKDRLGTVDPPTPTTWYKIKVLNNPTFVLNAAGTPANGTNVNVYTYNGSDAQLWQLIDVGSGYVKIVPRSNPNYCLDCSATPANGVNVQLWSYSGNTRQQWLKTDVGGGNNKITVRYDAAYGLDCSATPANNVNVQMWLYSGNNRQQWILEEVLKSGVESQPEVSSSLSLSCSPTYVTESAVISYAVAEDALTSVEVYNMFGQKVKDFGTNYQQAGEYKITLDGADLSKGMYVIKLRSGKSERTCKILK